MRTKCQCATDVLPSLRRGPGFYHFTSTEVAQRGAGCRSKNRRNLLAARHDTVEVQLLYHSGWGIKWLRANQKNVGYGLESGSFS